MRARVVSPFVAIILTALVLPSSVHAQDPVPVAVPAPATDVGAATGDPWTLRVPQRQLLRPQPRRRLPALRAGSRARRLLRRLRARASDQLPPGPGRGAGLHAAARSPRDGGRVLPAWQWQLGAEFAPSADDNVAATTASLGVQGQRDDLGADLHAARKPGGQPLLEARADRRLRQLRGRRLGPTSRSASSTCRSPSRTGSATTPRRSWSARSSFAPSACRCSATSAPCSGESRPITSSTTRWASSTATAPTGPTSTRATTSRGALSCGRSSRPRAAPRSGRRSASRCTAGRATRARWATTCPP